MSAKQREPSISDGFGEALDRLATIDMQALRRRCRHQATRHACCCGPLLRRGSDDYGRSVRKPWILDATVRAATRQPQGTCRCAFGSTEARLGRHRRPSATEPNKVDKPAEGRQSERHVDHYRSRYTAQARSTLTIRGLVDLDAT